MHSPEEIIVTGAGGGLGREVGAAFLKTGASVTGIDISADNLKATAGAWKAIGGKFKCAQLDITNEQAVELFFRDVGPVDVLVNAAGICHYGSVLELEAAMFRKVMEVNVVGAFLMLREAAKKMTAAGGSIINIASNAGLKGLFFMPAYCASKHALKGLGDAAGQELRAKRIRVTTYCPGQMNTSMLGPGDHPQALNTASVALSIVQIAHLPPELEVRQFYVEPIQLEGA